MSKIKSGWWKLSQRRSNRTIAAFSLGLEVGRMLTPTQTATLKTRMEDLYL